MARRDVVPEISPAASLHAIAVTVAQAGVGVDCQEYEDVALLVDTGIMGGSATPTVSGQWEDSPDNVTFTAIVAGQLAEGGLVPQHAVGNQSTTFERGYLGVSRYVRYNVTAVGGHRPFAAAVGRRDPHQAARLPDRRPTGFVGG